MGALQHADGRPSPSSPFPQAKAGSPWALERDPHVQNIQKQLYTLLRGFQRHCFAKTAHLPCHQGFQPVNNINPSHAQLILGQGVYLKACVSYTFPTQTYPNLSSLCAVSSLLHFGFCLRCCNANLFHVIRCRSRILLQTELVLLQCSVCLHKLHLYSHYKPHLALLCYWFADDLMADQRMDISSTMTDFMSPGSTDLISSSISTPGMDYTRKRKGSTTDYQ